MDCPLLSAVSLALKGTATPCMGPIKLGQPGGCPLFIESTGYEERRGPGVGGWCGLCVPDQHGKLAMFGPFALRPGEMLAERPVVARPLPDAPVRIEAAIRREGSDAFRQGTRLTACPYPRGSEAAKMWTMGWEAAWMDDLPTAPLPPQAAAHVAAAPASPTDPASDMGWDILLDLSLPANEPFVLRPPSVEGQETPTLEMLAENIAKMVGTLMLDTYGHRIDPPQVIGAGVLWRLYSIAGARAFLHKVPRALPRGARLTFGVTDGQSRQWEGTPDEVRGQLIGAYPP